MGPLGRMRPNDPGGGSAPSILEPDKARTMNVTVERYVISMNGKASLSYCIAAWQRS